MKPTMNKLPLLLVIAAFFISTLSVSAVEMESPRFRIESGDVSFEAPQSSDIPSSSVQRDTDTEVFESAGALIKTDGISSDSTPFQVKVDTTQMAMKNLTSGNPSTVTSSISIAGGRSTYLVYASTEDLMRKLTGETIPDTSCNGNKKCTPAIAALWNSVTSFGFGYSMKGEDIPSDFKSDSYFRPFPNLKKKQKETVIMKNNDKTSARRAEMTVKTVVSAVQPDGTYQTIVNITALPGY